MYIILYFLLSITNFCYNAYIFLCKYATLLMIAIEQRLYITRVHCYMMRPQNKSFSRNLKGPDHVAILIGHNISNPSIDILEIINFCVSEKIPYISVYDHRGILKKNGNFFKRNFIKHKFCIESKTDSSENSWRADDDCKIVLTAKSVDKLDSKINSLNEADGYSAKIQFLSYLDGKQKIVDLTKKIAAESLKSHKRKEAIYSIFESSLSSNIPDPDLALVLGDTLCTFGFLPWQSKITEFFIVPKSYHIGGNTFLKVLEKFNNCVQRYGK